MPHASVELCWLALARLFHPCPRLAHKLLEATHDVTEIFRLDEDEACAIAGGRYAAVSSLASFNDWRRCEDDMTLCRANDVSVIPYDDVRYPALLRMIDDPPVVIFARGAHETWHQRPCIALVGARKATVAGRSKAHELARDLARSGIGVVSGMAYGIDRAVHEGALDGQGLTIAVWGAGPDIVYPRAHAMLARAIMASGAAITEFPPGVGPAPHYFPQRNRVISGISLGVVVIEAAPQSGSLITARYALEQGREVCALPGSAGILACGGSNNLIREGACLVENAQDIIEAVFARGGDRGGGKNAGQFQNPSARETRLDTIVGRTRYPGKVACSDKGDALIPCAAAQTETDDGDPLMAVLDGGETVGLDELIQCGGLGAAETLRRLTQYTMEGLVEELPGRRYCLCGRQRR